MEQRDSLERSSSEAPPNPNSYAVNEKASNLGGAPLNGRPPGSDLANVSIPAQGTSDLSPAVDSVLNSDVSLSFESPHFADTLLIMIDRSEYSPQSP